MISRLGKIFYFLSGIWLLFVIVYSIQISSFETLYLMGILPTFLVLTFIYVVVGKD